MSCVGRLCKDYLYLYNSLPLIPTPPLIMAVNIGEAVSLALLPDLLGSVCYRQFICDSLYKRWCSSVPIVKRPMQKSTNTLYCTWIVTRISALISTRISKMIYALVSTWISTHISTWVFNYPRSPGSRTPWCRGTCGSGSRSARTAPARARGSSARRSGSGGAGSWSSARPRAAADSRYRHRY